MLLISYNQTVILNLPCMRHVRSDAWTSRSADPSSPRQNTDNLTEETELKRIKATISMPSKMQKISENI